MRVLNNRPAGGVHVPGFGVLTPGQSVDLPIELALRIVGEGIILADGLSIDEARRMLQHPEPVKPPDAGADFPGASEFADYPEQCTRDQAEDIAGAFRISDRVFAQLVKDGKFSKAHKKAGEAHNSPWVFDRDEVVAVCRAIRDKAEG